MSVDIRTKKGQRVAVTKESIKNGIALDKALAQRYLTVGRVYTVDRTEKAASHTRVWLKEIPGVTFNSVQFEDA